MLAEYDKTRRVGSYLHNYKSEPMFRDNFDEFDDSRWGRRSELVTCSDNDADHTERSSSNWSTSTARASPRATSTLARELEVLGRAMRYILGYKASFSCTLLYI